MGTDQLDVDLLRVLLDTEEKERAYDMNAEFHATVYSLVATLPSFLASYAVLGLARGEERDQEIRRLMHLDAENHERDLRTEHDDGSWRDREAPRE